MEPTTVQQLVVFSLGTAEYGLPITQVQEIIRYSQPRSVPSSPLSVRGVINLRGTIVPVCDLKQRLGLDRARSAESKIVIVESGRRHGGARRRRGRGGPVRRRGTARGRPRARTEAPSRPVARVGDRVLVLLDLDSLLASEGIDALPLAA
jgi:purine-binding chemotaxis protein CheW